MRHFIHRSLIALAVTLVAVGMSMSALAEVVSGAENWTIDPGTIPHIIFNRNRGINFALDKYGSNGWEVDVHHTSGGGYVEAGVVGSTVNSATFRSDLDQVEGTGDVFRFVFHWWPSQQSGSTVHYYGWVTLGTSNGELVVLASEVADEPNAVLVGRGEPDLSVVPSGPDDIEVISEKPDNIILQWDFTTDRDRNSIYTIPGIENITFAAVTLGMRRGQISTGGHASASVCTSSA